MGQLRLFLFKDLDILTPNPDPTSFNRSITYDGTVLRRLLFSDGGKWSIFEVRHGVKGQTAGHYGTFLSTNWEKFIIKLYKILRFRNTAWKKNSYIK